MGGKGKKGGGGGGYPWWQHLKNKGGKGADEGASPAAEPVAKMPKLDGPRSAINKYCCDLEGSGYGSYKDLKGEWKEDSYTVFVDHVQGDAYAPPSSVRVRIPNSVCGYPATTNSASRASFVSDKTVNLACCDFFQRHLNSLLRGGTGIDWTQIGSGGGGGWSSSKGGGLAVDDPSQFILERSCVVMTTAYTEVRATLALPAHGRTIEGKKAAQAFDALVYSVQQSCIFRNFSKEMKNKLDVHIKCVEDQEYLRSVFLEENELISFVANGAILPRLSGADDRPMNWTKSGSDAPVVVPFESPASMEITAHLPNNGVLKGMGIKKGVSLIVGGGFHGKSTLLEAIQTGVYSKIPGDGREYVVTDENAYKVRSEDGRPVSKTDISLFIKDLPRVSTKQFTTKDASGSTSQAANIVEGIEAGATALLLDEDTCATNFMIRDQRMQMLVSRDKEPIQPFIEKIPPLYEQLGVSCILVVGACGDFFKIADTVICMESYKASDVTIEAKNIIAQTENINANGKTHSGPIDFRPRFLAGGDNGCYSSGKSSARSLRCIAYGDEEVELTFVEQLVEISQARALCDILQYVGDAKFINTLKLIDPQTGTRLSDSKKVPFRDLLDGLQNALKRKDDGACGLDLISRMSGPGGFYAKPRGIEIACAINRLRTAKFA